MKVLIDARMYQESGIGRYIRNLIFNLQSLDKKNEYSILHLKEDYDTLVYHNNFRKVPADFSWYSISEQMKLPKLINQLRPDLVHFPHFNMPIFYRGKFVVTIHDLIHKHFSMRRSTTHGPLAYKFKQFGYKKVFQHAVKKSLKIFTPSAFVKKQLIDEWGIDSGKVEITPEAFDNKMFRTANKMNIEKSIKVIRKLNIKLPYLFYVGNAHPHKNVEGLTKAFLKLKKAYKDLNLVLSGNNNFFWEKVKNENRHKHIIYTGLTTDEELVALYKNAVMFVMPSFEEGFGIPLLEAMACSCPVVSSNSGALPEVGGDAALYFDPHDMVDMGDKIDMVLKSEKLRKEMVEKGKKRVKLFSWERLAKQTLEVYNQCV